MSESPETRRERQRKKAAAFRAQGLTSKGKPRKERAKPTPQAAKFVIGPVNPTYKRREPTVPKKGETAEQRRARGASIRGTPMARDIDDRVRRRIEAMED